MKFLMLMRHAKSNWSDEGMQDFDRPLNGRGEKDAKRMGAELLRSGRIPDVVVTSTAVRAMETTRRVCSQLGAAVQDNVQLQSHLYAASADTILEVINSLPSGDSSALLVGHNPGMQDAVTRITGTCGREGMKTAAIACIHLNLEVWSDVSDGSGELVWMLYPAMFKDE